MADDDELLAAVQVEAVKQAYTEELLFIAGRIEANANVGTPVSKFIAEGLSWLPWIGGAFEEEVTGPAAALSSVSRDTRVRDVIKKIEERSGFTLDDETKANIREDVLEMYKEAESAQP